MTRLEDTGSCFLVDLDLSLTHLQPLRAHGLRGEGEETTVRARLGRGSLTPRWNITANITRSEKSHEIKDLTAGVQSRQGPNRRSSGDKAINQCANQCLLTDFNQVHSDECPNTPPQTSLRCKNRHFKSTNGAFMLRFGHAAS